MSKINSNSDNIKIEGYYGTWYVIDEAKILGEKLFLIEHEFYGGKIECLIVDENGTLILNDVWNGFDDYYDYLASLGIVVDLDVL